jgi:hypothetical protein
MDFLKPSKVPLLSTLPVALLLGVTVPARAEPAFLFEPRISVGSDFQAGLKAGVGRFAWAGGQATPFGEVEVRFAPERVRVRETPTLSYQYEEDRLNLGGGLAWSRPLAVDPFPDNPWFGVFSAGAFYSFGSYRGTAREAVSGWRPFAEAGVRYGFDGYAFAAGLKVSPQPHVFPVRLTLGMIWDFL